MVKLHEKFYLGFKISLLRPCLNYLVKIYLFILLNCLYRNKTILNFVARTQLNIQWEFISQKGIINHAFYCACHSELIITLRHFV